MRLYHITLLAILAIPTAATAGAIQVATTTSVPTPRLWLQSGSDAYVWQTHTIRLAEGQTQLTFPFAAADIDLDSLHLELAEPREGVAVGSRLQDPGAPQSATWVLTSDRDTEVHLRLGYALRGIEWRIDYTANLDPEALSCALQADFTLTNRSKKQFDSVIVRLPDGQRLTTPLDIGQSTQFPLFRLQNLPFALSYVYDVPRYGDGVVALLTHLRTADEERGNSALLPGHVRIYGPGPGGASTLIGEDNVAYCPPQEKLEFKIAGVPEISVAKRRVSGAQVNPRTDVLKKLVMFDLDEEFEFTVRNKRRSDVVLVLRDSLPGAWEMQKSTIPFARTAADQIEAKILVQAGEELKVGYSVRTRNQQP